MGARILDSFSLFLEFLPYSSPSERPPNILEKRHYVEHAGRALQLLAEHPLATRGTAANKPSSKAARRKGKKPAKYTVSTNVIDPKVFDGLGVPVPADEDEIYAVMKDIVDELRRCMEVSSVHCAVITMHNMVDIVLSACLASCPPTRLDTACVHF